METKKSYEGLNALTDQSCRGKRYSSIIQDALSVADALNGEGPYFGGNTYNIVTDTDGGGFSSHTLQLTMRFPSWSPTK